MLRDLLVALSVVVLMVIFATALPLVIADPTTIAILGVAFPIGIVAAVVRETEILVGTIVFSSLLWLCHALLGFFDPVPVVVLGGFVIRAWKHWSSPRTPSPDATTLDSPAATPET